VLLVFNTSNDVLENHHALLDTTVFPYPSKPWFALEDGRLAARDYPLPAPSLARRLRFHANATLRRYSELYRVLSTLRLPRLGLEPGDAHAAPATGTEPAHPWLVYAADYPPEWRTAWRITRGLVLALRRDVEGHGARFAVAVINSKEEIAERAWQFLLFANPSWRERAWDLEKPNRLITEFLARRGVPVVPLRDTFRAHYDATGRTGFYALDVHWTAEGHALAAAALERGLGALGLLPAAEARP
jgi:hypothetical protein